MTSNGEYFEYSLVNRTKMDGPRDLTLAAGLDGKKFLVHRNVMLASSAYFGYLLAQIDQPDSDIVEIRFSAISGNTMKTIIDFCYHGYADISSANIDEVMAAAVDMGLVHLKQMCIHFWIENESMQSSVRALMFADKFNMYDLWNNALSFICHHFDEMPIAEMAQLDPDNFNAILREDDITAAESDIFDCLVRWVRHDETNRSPFIIAMATNIRMEHLSDDFLNDVVEPFLASYGCTQLVLDEYSRRSRDPVSYTRHRTKSIYFAEITDPGEIDIYKFNRMALEFKYFGNVSFDARKKPLFSDGNLFLIDDASGETTNVVEACDLVTGDGGVLPKVPLKSISSPPISIGNYLYAFDEFHSDSDGVDTTTCARFDIKRIRWQIFQPLAFRMQQISAIELNGLMYLTGTVDRSENDTSNFWCYDPYRNVWSEKACIELGGAKIVLCKAQRSIFVCNHHVGFLLYDETLDEWVKLNVDTPVDREGMRYHITDAIDCGNESYGILSSDRGLRFVDISLPLGENRCRLSSFMEYYLDDVDSDETQLHLFVY